MSRRGVLLAALVMLATGVASCGDRPGDSGGAASGDNLPGGAGAAETHDSLEAMRDDTTTRR